jgi:mannose-6-phosphate isomerase-like protein (cupin superfamily)
LEKKADSMVAKRVIYPGAKPEFKTGSAAVRKLVVTDGSAKTTVDKKSHFLNKGQSLSVSEKQLITVENIGQENLGIIDIEIQTI